MKVFLSSTAQDLVAYRRVADDTILRMSQEAVVMERFGPLPGEPVAECERKARECDVTVCIVAHRYGFVPDKGLGSITRREVEAAKTAGRDVLAWIVADDFRWTEKKEQDLLTDPTVLADPARVGEVVEGVQALLDFKAWLRATFVCEAFTTPDDLGRKIAVALGASARRAINRQPTAAATRAQNRGEIRIVHALQPAPHFNGREQLVEDLDAWVSDLTSPDRVWSLVAAGGTGKTAVAERVVAGMKPGEANVLVWSFYERPDADAFLRECNQLFLGEEDGPAGGRLERLERGLRDGRPHLIVLDGLERVQEDAGGGRVRGELSDHTLKLLLRALAAGLGRARALVTSRYPLVDLHDWTNRGYRDTSLDDLSPEAAVAVLRGWGVAGHDDALRAAAAQVGNHALSVAVLSSYLHSFANGHIEAVKEFDLDAVSGDDPRAAKLARVLAYYAQRLPEGERELLARLSVFARGVTIDLLGVLIDAGGEVAGLLLKAKPRLVALLGSLRARGLVFQYQAGDAVTWTAHPFLRERFRELLGCPAEKVFDVVAQALGAGLEKRPDTHPSEPTALDRYEGLIEATRLAGREQEAFDLFRYGLGDRNLAWVLGEYERGYRILAAFSATGRPEDLGVTMPPRERSTLANALSVFAKYLGRLAEARAIRRLDDGWEKSLAEPERASIALQNSCEVAFDLGRLVEARELAGEAVNEAEAASDNGRMKTSLTFRAIAAHALGGVATARADFAAATELEGKSLYSLPGSQHARHHLDLGNIAAAQALAHHGLAMIRRSGWNFDLPRFEALLARIALAEGGDPTPHLDEIRIWTSRTGDMGYIIEAHLLAARHLLARGDSQAALGEAETGLLHAVTCGYGLLRIELLVAMLASGWRGPIRPRPSRRRGRRSTSPPMRTAATPGAKPTQHKPGARRTSPTASSPSRNAPSPAPSKCAAASNIPEPLKRSDGSHARSNDLQPRVRILGEDLLDPIGRHINDRVLRLLFHEDGVLMQTNSRILVIAGLSSALALVLAAFSTCAHGAISDATPTGETPARIGRMWHGRVPDSKAAEYYNYLNREGIDRIEKIPGNLGADVMTSAHDGVTEFLVISYWSSLDEIKAYAGADVEKVHNLPRDSEFLIEPESKVRHFIIRRSDRHAAVRPPK